MLESATTVVGLDTSVDHDQSPYKYYIIWGHGPWVRPCRCGYMQTGDDPALSHVECNHSVVTWVSYFVANSLRVPAGESCFPMYV